MDLDQPTEEQVRLLTDSRNRTILTILNNEGSSLHVKDLAERLVSRDVTVVRSATYEDQLERVLISLHHDRLPRLTEADLIAYDTEKNIATYRESPTLIEEWQDGTILDALEGHLRTNHEADEEQIGTITGRESVIRYGRQLADESEEELFCMYVSPDLLEEKCIWHGKNALDRGVHMYMGTQNQTVRDLTRKHLPEATIWEPQLDLLNTSTHPRIGRLVLVDRRKVMLAVLEEPKADGIHSEETALVGEGEDHPLVVLVRELLGSRLDHLDYQSNEFRSGLPS